jgi:hypothetical protein
MTRQTDTDRRLTDAEITRLLSLHAERPAYGYADIITVRDMRAALHELQRLRIERLSSAPAALEALRDFRDWYNAKYPGPEHDLPDWLAIQIDLLKLPSGPRIEPQAVEAARRMVAEIIENDGWSFTGDEVLLVARTLLAVAKEKK